MQFTYPDFTNLFSLAIPALLVLLLAELILLATWNKAYFSVGLPIYGRSIPLTGFGRGLPTESELEDEFEGSYWSKPYIFHAFSDHEYGFREELFSFRLFQRRSSSVMHGILIYDPNGQQIVVKGYANWSMLLVLLIFLGVGIGIANFMSIFFLLFFPAILVVMYLIERNRFDQVLEAAARSTML
jgi:hypothetical protein